MNCLEKFGMHLANTVCFINLLPWLYGNRSISHSVGKIYKGNQEGRGLLWRQTERAGNNPVWEGNARSFRLIWGLAESTKQAGIPALHTGDQNSDPSILIPCPTWSPNTSRSNTTQYRAESAPECGSKTRTKSRTKSCFDVLAII